MLNRWFGIIAAILMLSANAALFLRDVAPQLFAGEPPKPAALALRPGDEEFRYAAIYGPHGEKVGRSWTEMTRAGELITVRTETFLNPSEMRANLALPALFIRTEFHWLKDEHLEDFQVSVRGLGVTVEVQGAYIPPNDFPCKWQFGEQRGSFILPVEATRAVGDLMRPLGELPDLQVGQSWRQEILNPLAKLMPEWSPSNPFGEGVIVQVVATEILDLADRSVKCAVVEADRLKAWISADGRVLRQEIDLPLFGRISIVDEPYDRRALRAARHEFSGRR